MEQNNTVLSRMFSQNSLKGLIAQDDDATSTFYSIVRRYKIDVNEGMTNEEVISEIYSYLDHQYRNEYFYKNTLLNKLIVNVHRLRTTVALTEVPIAKSKADFIMINGKAVVYEIKTELDTFDRLKSQIADYYKAFDHVCVVTSLEQSEILMKEVENSPLGIYVLSKRNTIQRIKEPQEYREKLDLRYIFKILNKPEYEQLLLRLGDTLPDVTPINYYRACQKLFYKHGIDEVYPLFLKTLKSRNRIDVVDFKAVPYALRFLAYFAKYRNAEYQELDAFLAEQFCDERR